MISSSNSVFIVARDIILILEVYYTIISLVGVVINLWAAYDSHRDLARLRIAKINSLIEKTGRISYRDATSIVFMHILFFSIGIIGLTGDPSVANSLPLSRFIAIFLYVIFASIVQTGIILAQFLNQIDRIQIRNQLVEEAMFDAER